MIIILEIYIAGAVIFAFLVGLLNAPENVEPYSATIAALAWPIIVAGCTGAFIRSAILRYAAAFAAMVSP